MPSVQEASAERPEMTDEERQQLEELQAKADAEARALKEEEAEKARLEREERLREMEHRPLEYILVRHMGRSPRTRTLRAARAGHRRQGIVLADGKRIRKKGKKRLTQLDLRQFVENHRKLLELVRVGALEFCDPRSSNPIPYERLVEIVQMFGERFAEMDHEAAMNAYEEAKAAWKEACKGLDKDEAPPKPEKPRMVEFELDESGQQDGFIAGGDKLFNTAPMPPTEDGTGLLDDDGEEFDEEDEEDGEDDGDDGGGEEAGGGETDKGSSEEENAGDTTPDFTKDGEDNGYTSEQLGKMTRAQLNEVASKEYGIDNPEGFPNKDSVIEAIFAASEEAEGEE